MLKKCKKQSIVLKTFKIQSRIEKNREPCRKTNQNFAKLSTNRKKFSKIAKNVEKL